MDLENAARRDLNLAILLQTVKHGPRVDETQVIKHMESIYNPKFVKQNYHYIGGICNGILGEFIVSGKLSLYDGTTPQEAIIEIRKAPSNYPFADKCT